MSGIQFRAQGNPVSAVSTSGPIAPAVPVTAQVGDGMFAVLAMNCATGVARTITTPAGWVSIFNQFQTGGGGGVQLVIFARTAQAGDPGATVSMAWTGGSVSDSVAGAVVVYNGIDTSILSFDALVSAVTTPASTISHWGTPQAMLNDTLIMIGAGAGTGAVINGPAATGGFAASTVRLNNTIGCSFSIYDVPSTAGVTVIPNGTMAAGFTMIGTSVPVRPARTPTLRAAVHTLPVSTGATINVAMPAGIQNGDYALIGVGWSNATVTPPDLSASGWTTIRTVQGNSNGFVVYGKFCTTADSSTTVAVTLSAAPGSIMASSAVYVGVDRTTPIDASAIATGALSTTMVAPSVTETVANDLLVCVFSNGSGGSINPGSTPPGMVQDSDLHIVMFYDEASGNAVASGTRSLVQGAANVWAAATIALKAQVGAPILRGVCPSSSSGISVASFAATAPAGIVAGDTLIAYVSLSVGSVTGLTPPAGWAQLGATVVSGGSVSAIYTKTAGAGEPATYTFTWSTGSAVTVMIWDIGASGGGTPVIDASSMTNTGSATAQSTPTITTTKAPELVLFGIGMANGNLTFTPPLGTIENADTMQMPSGNPQITNGQFEAASEVLGTAAVVGTRTFTLTGAINATVAAISLAVPAPSSGLAMVV